jgi:hypothetical protein
MLKARIRIYGTWLAINWIVSLLIRCYIVRPLDPDEKTILRRLIELDLNYIKYLWKN